MTVIVSVKINDGIVLASDSASTFTNAQVYDHAEKDRERDEGFTNRCDDIIGSPSRNPSSAVPTLRVVEA